MYQIYLIHILYTLSVHHVIGQTYFNSNNKRNEAIKKKEILPVVATWLDSEGIRLSAGSLAETNTACCHLDVESKRLNSEIERRVVLAGGRGWGTWGDAGQRV